MPGWSPEIANEFIRMGRQRGHSFNQMQLQKLVYVAHGWTLAQAGQPLTGDRPEAWSFGPVYRRLSDALAHYGIAPVTSEIRTNEFQPFVGINAQPETARADLIPFEMDTIAMVYQDYGLLDSCHLSLITQTVGTPWARVFADGAGEFKDIPHDLVRAQFVEFAEEAERSEESS
jgi:uncharacterized phage-associated protein